MKEKTSIIKFHGPSEITSCKLINIHKYFRSLTLIKVKLLQAQRKYGTLHLFQPRKVL